MDALQKIVDKIDPSSSDSIYAIRGFLTDLLPVGPLLDWESGNGDVNRSTPEEVVGWMEGIVFSIVVLNTNSRVIEQLVNNIKE